jgi:Fe-S cluster biosynthesis and repair protein YggX
MRRRFDRPENRRNEQERSHGEVPFDTHPLGQRIYENVSKEAWKLWLEQMKMIMNEYRLNLGTQEAQEFLLKQMEEYFFGEGSSFPPGYVPPRAKN